MDIGDPQRRHEVIPTVQPVEEPERTEPAPREPAKRETEEPA